MKRLAKEIGDERMVEDSWCGDRCTLRFGSLENVIGYSYRFKDHERTIRILPEDESSYPIEYYTIFFKNGTKKEFSINQKYMLLWNMKLANDEVEEYTRSYSEIHPHTCEMDDYNDSEDFTGTHVTTFDIYLKYTYNRYKENCVWVFNPDVLTIEEEPTLKAEDCLGEMKRLANYLGDGEVKKHHDDDGVYTLSISSLKNVTGYSLRFRNYERTIRLF
ncbi:MAG: hypothetical protein Pg6B_10880 [Candidatus Azobacteroides pseudotrichonymphae]|nr:MAG: hypothetical protein Pg6B_10880 [Candidatus Azobacteroides pseudotrichonymphae]